MMQTWASPGFLSAARSLFAHDHTRCCTTAAGPVVLKFVFATSGLYRPGFIIIIRLDRRYLFICVLFSSSDVSSDASTSSLLACAAWIAVCYDSSSTHPSAYLRDHKLPQHLRHRRKEE